MKTLVVCCCLAMISAGAFAQVEEVSDTLPGQQDKGGLETPIPPEQKEDRVEVMIADIPPTMRTELEQNEKYEGWESGNLFYEKNTEQYLLHIQKTNTTQTFRFDKNGKPLQDEKILEPEGERN